jgi:hypothetical protein
MRDHLAVGLRAEPIAFDLQVFLQRLVVFDHPVVNDGNLAIATPVRMSVLCDGGPCVAHRVWPMPRLPDSGQASSCSFSTAIRPTDFETPNIALAPST